MWPPLQVTIFSRVCKYFYSPPAALRLLLSSVLLAVWPGVGLAVLGAGLLLLVTTHLKLLQDGAATSLVRIFGTTVSLTHGE